MQRHVLGIHGLRLAIALAVSACSPQEAPSVDSVAPEWPLFPTSSAAPLPAAHSNVADLLQQAPARATEVPAPLELTTSDGQGLELRQVVARAVLEGPLAHTELHLTFRNPEARQREGRFRLTLPPRAAVARFAMKIGGSWMEGEVVEKQKARVIYEDFLHRRKDPALLEQDAGNQFSARVFPIEAHEDKELIVAWSQELTDATSAYTLPLRGLPELERLSVRVFLGSVAPQQAANSRAAPLVQVPVVALEREKFRPPLDLQVHPQAVPPGRDALRAGDIVVGRVQLRADTQPEAWGRVVVLVDTSASMAPAQALLRTRLQALATLAHRNGAQSLEVVAFDQTAEVVFTGNPGDFGSAAMARLGARKMLGASNLTLGLRSVGAILTHGKGPARVVLLSDGVPTLGERDPQALRKQLAAWRATGVQRFDAVTVTAARDEDLLQALTSAGLERSGVVVDAQASDAALSRLLTRSHGTLRVAVPGARWSFPREVHGAQAGHPILVYAEVAEGEPLVVELSGDATATIALEPRNVAKPLLERAWAGARIRSLLQGPATGDGDVRESMRKQAVELSIRHRVLCPETALLVLETEADYARYGLDRKALADILTVAPDGAVKSAQRQAVPAGPAGTSREPTPAEVAGPSGTPFLRASTKPTATSSLAGSIGLRDILAGQAGDENLVIGHGSGGMGWRNIELDGGGGYGRMHSLAALDTGGGTGRNANVGANSHRARSVARVGIASGQSTGGCDKHDIAKNVRTRAASLRACYETFLLARPDLAGKVTVTWTIAADGRVANPSAVADTLGSPDTTACVVRTIRRIWFAKPEAGVCVVRWPFVFSVAKESPRERRQRLRDEARWEAESRRADRLAARESRRLAAEDRRLQGQSRRAARDAVLAKLREAAPYDGRYAAIQASRKQKDGQAALQESWAWLEAEPGDVLALVALGQSLLDRGQAVQAARAFGAIFDLHPQRADIGRFAGQLLEQTGVPGRAAALDVLAQARRQREDQPTGHLAHAVALMKSDRLLEAMDVLDAGLSARHRWGNYPSIQVVFQDLLGLCAAAHLVRLPIDAKTVHARLARHGVSLPTRSALRVLLTWETDANDVDLHVLDGRNGHAFYADRDLPSGGTLHADVTTGYGPEVMAIDAPAAFPYRLAVHYYSRGPMGFGMGRVQVIRWTGKGLSFEDRPFVLQRDHAWVDLGTVER